MRWFYLLDSIVYRIEYFFKKLRMRGKFFVWFISQEGFVLQLMKVIIKEINTFLKVVRYCIRERVYDLRSGNRRWYIIV